VFGLSEPVWEQQRDEIYGRREHGLLETDERARPEHAAEEARRLVARHRHDDGRQQEELSDEQQDAVRKPLAEPDDQQHEDGRRDHPLRFHRRQQFAHLSFFIRA
jgi:hypothetical protein